MPADVYSLGIGVHVDREAVATAIDGLKSSLGDQSASIDKLAATMGGGSASIDQLANSLVGLETTRQSAGVDKLTESMRAGDEGIEGYKAAIDELVSELERSQEAIKGLGTAADSTSIKSAEAADRARGAMRRFAGATKKAREGADEDVGGIIASLGKLVLVTRRVGRAWQSRGGAVSGIVAALGELGTGGAVAGGVISGVATVLSTVGSVAVEVGSAIWSAFSSATGVVKEFVVTALSTGFAFMKEAEEVEDATQRMAVQFGGGRQEAAGLRREIITLGIATGASLEDVTKLAVGMSMAGAKLGEFSTDTQKSMARLSAVFGLSGEDIAKTSRSLQLMGGSLDTLLGDAAAFTKTFGIPGVMQELPQIVSAAKSVMLKFGGAITASGSELARNTMNLGGIIAKTYGVTMAEAIGIAAESMQKFAEQANQDRGVFLGLDEDFSGLTKTLHERGVGIFQAMEITRLAGENNTDALVRLRQEIDRTPYEWLKKRFVEQLRRELPEAIFGIIKNVDVLNARIADETAQKQFAESIGGRGVAAFNALGDSMLASTKGFRAILNNIIELTQAIGGQIAISLGLPEILKDVGETFQDWATEIHEFVESGDFMAWVERVKPTIVSVGEVFREFGVIVGPIGTALKSLFAGASVDPKMLSTMTGRVGRAFDKLLNTVGGWLKNLDAFMRDNMPSMTLFAGIFGNMIGNAINSGFKKIGDFLIRNMPFITKMAERVGGVLGSVIGSAIGSIDKAEVARGLDVVFGVIYVSTLKFFDGLGAGVLESFGMTGRSLRLRMMGAWLEIQHDAQVMWDGLTGGFMALIEGMALAPFDQVERVFKAMLSTVQFGALTGFGVIKESFLSLVDSMRTRLEILSVSNESIWVRSSKFILGVFKDLAVNALSSISAVIDAMPFASIMPGVSTMQIGLNSAIGTIKSLESSLDDLSAGSRDNAGKTATALDTATAQVIAGIESEAEARRVARQTARTEDIKANADTLSGDLATIKERQTIAGLLFNVRKKQRSDDAKQRDREYKKATGLVASLIVAEEDKVAAKRKAAILGNQFNLEAQSGLEATLTSFADSTVKLQGINARGLKAGEAKLRDYMDASIASISTSVSKGALSSEEAAARLLEASTKGMEEARRAALEASKPIPGEAVTPESISKKATLPENLATWNEMIANFQQSLKDTRDTRVDKGMKLSLEIRGGDPLTQVLARHSAVKYRDTNGGD